MSSASHVLAVVVLLLSCSAGWAEQASQRRPERGEVERLERLPPVAPGDWVPQPVLAGVYPRTSAAGAHHDRPPEVHRAEVSGPLPAGRVDRAVYAPPEYRRYDWAGDGGGNLGRLGASGGYRVSGAFDPPDEGGPVFDGCDGPDEVSPAYGGTDMPHGSRSLYEPGDRSSGLAASGPPRSWLGRDGRLCAELREAKIKIWSDHRNYYSWPTLRDMALGFGAGAILANTAVDRHFQDWYQDDVRSSGTDDVAVFFKTFGEGQIFIPAFAGLALLDVFCEDLPVLGIAGDFGDRVTRAYLVGAPPMLLMQLVTGASRPGEASCDSQWKPFDDNNGVSGHAFMGAVPFITAARMSDGFLLKSGFYILSAFTAWSRVNDDRHYLSQACLGWWMAYLACRAVDQTDYYERRVAITPIATPEMTGLGIIVRL